MSETGLLPAYLIVGTDGVKRDHAVSRMKARLEKTGMVEFNLDERDMTKDPDIESIIGSLRAACRLSGESQPHDGLPYHRRLACQEHAPV